MSLIDISENIDFYLKKQEGSVTASDEKPIWLLLGEGDFNFTKCLVTEEDLIDKYNVRDYKIIATEFRDLKSINEIYDDFVDNYLRIKYPDFDVTIKYKIDVNNFSPEKKLDIITFNFPWWASNSDSYPGREYKTTAKLIMRIFEFASNYLKPNGILKLGLVHPSSVYFEEYELDLAESIYSNLNRKNHFNFDNWMRNLYPNYKPKSSKKGSDLIIHGYEIIYQLQKLEVKINEP